MRRYETVFVSSRTAAVVVGSCPLAAFRGMCGCAQTSLSTVTACSSTGTSLRPPKSHTVGTRLLAWPSGARHVGLLRPTAVTRFDIKQHEMEKRRRRELEKAGVDPDDEDELPWVAPEEQQRIDEEEAQRRAEEEERRRAFLEKREKEDALKRKQFKEFRARQIALSQERKKTVAAKKEEQRAYREQTQAEAEEGDETPDSTQGTPATEDTADDTTTPASPEGK